MYTGGEALPFHVPSFSCDAPPVPKLDERSVSEVGDGDEEGFALGREGNPSDFTEKVDLLRSRVVVFRFEDVDKVGWFGHGEEAAVARVAERADSADAAAHHGDGGGEVAHVPDAARLVLVPGGELHAVGAPRRREAVVQVPLELRHAPPRQRVAHERVRVIPHHHRALPVRRDCAKVDGPLKLVLRRALQRRDVERAHHRVVVRREHVVRAARGVGVQLDRVGDGVVVVSDAREVRLVAALHVANHHLAVKPARHQKLVARAHGGDLYPQRAVVPAREVHHLGAPPRDGVPVVDGVVVHHVHVVLRRRPHEVAQLEVHDGRLYRARVEMEIVKLVVCSHRTALRVQRRVVDLRVYIVFVLLDPLLPIPLPRKVESLPRDALYVSAARRLAPGRVPIVVVVVIFVLVGHALEVENEGSLSL
mmetsp:Transcript_10046/g.32956  ORF Transcript_10046/g.32956 Transcript_10046/m.32956 type:complete len:421 (-) Transcript_10046:83-1345(-)